jgi:hypothetical protein
MFGSIPFIIEMQDQKALTIINYLLNEVEPSVYKIELNHLFEQEGITIEMLSPKVQDMVSNLIMLGEEY